MVQKNSISGFTIARNIEKFQYPFEQWCESIKALDLDEVLISYDPNSEDTTEKIVEESCRKYGFNCYPSIWNLENRNAGTEIGIQTDLASEQLSSDWHLYLQLDEAIHEKDKEELHKLVNNSSDVNGFDFLRLYFFGNLNTIRKDWTVQITRLTKAGTHSYKEFDGMNCSSSVGGIHYYTTIPIYHYSRIGDPSIISQRVRNLDTFFHREDSLIPEHLLPAYDFKTRQWDNYSKIEHCPEVDREFIEYQGIHPKSFENLYK